MALFASHNGNFQVEAISFSPNVITMGEKTSYSISIKNVSGRNITRLIMDMHLRFLDKNGVAQSSNTSRVFGSYPLENSLGYWNNGQTVTFTGVFELSSIYELDNSTRVIPTYKAADVGYIGEEDIGLMLHITADGMFSNSMTNTDAFYNLRGPNSEYLTVIDGRYKPSISVFDVERSTGENPDDEGENLLTAVRLSLSDKAFSDRLRLWLRFEDKTSSYTGEIDLSSLINPALKEEMVALIRETFDKSADWKISLWFGDSYESAEEKRDVPKSFTNVHLSGASTGGVCFGGFSKATEGNPLFQCYYPAEFNGGIEGVNNFTHGEVKTGGKWVDGKSIYRSAFSFEFESSGNGLEVGEVSDIGTLIGVSGAVRWNNADVPYWLPITHYLSADNLHTVFFIGNKLVMNTKTACSGHVIVDYTKTIEEVSV